MSTISSVGGASSAWADLSSARASAMKEKMFAKVDSDSSGSIDTSELQGMLDHIGEKSGTSLGSATDLLGKMDSDGNGSLSKDELDTGMKSLMPAPSSTMDFALQRADGSGGPPPPPPPSDSASDSASSSSTQANDPLDTDGDGVVSAQEQAAGDLKALMDALVSAMDTDGDKSISTSEIDSFTSQLEAALGSVASSQGTGSGSNGSSGASSAGADSSTSRQQSLDLSSLADLLLKSYGQTAANYSQAPNFSIAA